MTHLIGPRGSQGGLRSLVGIAVGLFLLVATAAESAHTHAESDLSAVCSVCAAGHHSGAPPTAAAAPAIVGPGVLRALVSVERGLASETVHLSPRRSRAPPPSISL